MTLAQDTSKLKLYINKLIEYSQYNSMVASCRSILSSKHTHEMFLSILNGNTDVNFTTQLGQFYLYPDTSNVYISKTTCNEAIFNIFDEDVAFYNEIITLIQNIQLKETIQLNTKKHKQSTSLKHKVFMLHNKLDDEFNEINTTFDSHEASYICRLVYKISMCSKQNDKYLLYYNAIKKLYTHMITKFSIQTFEYNNIILRQYGIVRVPYLTLVHTAITKFDVKYNTNILKLFNKYVDVINTHTQHTNITKFTIRYKFIKD